MKKRRLFLLLGITSLSVGTLGFAVGSFAAFQTKKQLGRITTVKRMIELSVSGSGWEGAKGKHYGVYLWKSGVDGSGEFANHGAFMTWVSTNTFQMAIPWGYDKIIFVWHTDSATVASWDTQAKDKDKNPTYTQTVDMDLTDSFNHFQVYGSANWGSPSSGEYNQDSWRKGGKWESSFTTYSYSPT